MKNTSRAFLIDTKNSIRTLETIGTLDIQEILETLGTHEEAIPTEIRKTLVNLKLRANYPTMRNTSETVVLTNSTPISSRVLP